MSQIWRGVSGGIEVLENVNEMADLPDISTINSEGVWYIESGGFGPDYIAPTNWDSSAGEFTDWFSLFDGRILADIPGSEDLHAHYDAQTLNLSDGEAVNVWEDETANGNDLAKEGGEPNFVADAINGNPVVSLSDDSDLLETDFDTSISQPNTTIIVGRFTEIDDSIFTFYFGGIDQSTSHNFAQGNDGDDLWISTDTSLRDQNSAADTDYHIWTAHFDSNDAFLEQDGTEIASGDVGDNDMGSLRLGNFHNMDRPASIEVGEILLYEKDKTDIITEIEEYIDDKWGISVS